MSLKGTKCSSKHQMFLWGHKFCIDIEVITVHDNPNTHVLTGCSGSNSQPEQTRLTNTSTFSEGNGGSLAANSPARGQQGSNAHTGTILTRVNAGSTAQQPHQPYQNTTTVNLQPNHDVRLSTTHAGFDMQRRGVKIINLEGQVADLVRLLEDQTTAVAEAHKLLQELLASHEDRSARLSKPKKEFPKGCAENQSEQDRKASCQEGVVATGKVGLERRYVSSLKHWIDRQGTERYARVCDHVFMRERH